MFRLTGGNERTNNRVNERAKPDEQLNDRVNSPFDRNLNRLKRIDFLIFNLNKKHISLLNE